MRGRAPRSAVLVPALVLTGVAGALLAPSDARAEYLAYAVHEKKGDIPLPEDVRPIAKKNAKKLVQVKWGDYAGKKLRVGVMEANNDSNVASYQMSGPDGTYTWSASSDMNTVPVNGIDAILTDVLTQTGRFRVLTRTELGSVLDEQDLGDSGRVARPSAAKIGSVLGAQYLIQVVVNSYEPNVSGKKGGLGGIGRKFLGGIKAGKNKSYVSMTFKLIDAVTSEVVASEVVEATISDMNIGFGGAGWGGAGALAGFMSGYSKTPIGQAVIAAVNIGVFEIIKQIGNRPLTGSIVKLEPSQVIVNLGSDFVSAGDTFVASSKGEEFIDPETGLSLGADEEEIGTLKITEVREKYSYAEPMGFSCDRLKRGDKLVSTKKAQAFEFGSPW